jgi:hypothetical protein
MRKANRTTGLAGSAVSKDRNRRDRATPASASSKTATIVTATALVLDSCRKLTSRSSRMRAPKAKVVGSGVPAAMS